MQLLRVAVGKIPSLNKGVARCLCRGAVTQLETGISVTGSPTALSGTHCVHGRRHYGGGDGVRYKTGYHTLFYSYHTSGATGIS